MTKGKRETSLLIGSRRAGRFSNADQQADTEGNMRFRDTVRIQRGDGTRKR